MADDFDFEERAAIKEFLGNMPREQAEREAREEQIRRAQRNAIKNAKAPPGLFPK